MEINHQQPAEPTTLPLNTEVTIPLFLYSLDLPLRNSEVEPHLKWSKNCMLIEEDDHIIGVCSLITSTKRYVPVVPVY